jgi:exodeoxyribonuclease V beta subunit
MHRLNQEVVLERFKIYQQSLFASGQGVYVMLMQFVHDHQLRERMLDLDRDNGERKLSNLIQLMELLNSVENKKQFTPHELLAWMVKAVEGKEMEGDEFVQRIDNDETSVKIITVHKSKGLEYKVVLAPNLDLDTASKTHVTTEEFRSETDGLYYFEQRGLLTQECEGWRTIQAEQENRRLLYVALTRAKYK